MTLPVQTFQLPDLSERAIGRQAAVRDGQVTAHGRDVQRAFIAGARAGLTLTEIMEQTGVSADKLTNLRRVDPPFAEQLEQEQLDASRLAVEEIKLVPYREPDPRVARVKIDALAKYLELRWPDRYGKRVNMTVQHLDLRGALAEARERVAQVIDSTCKRVDVETDKLSVSDVDDLL